MEDLDDDPYGERRDYDSDDSRINAELVATGLHGVQLTEEGGDDDGEDVTEVFHIDRENPFQWLILTYEQIVRGVWRSKWRKDITWFNVPGPKEMAVVHLAVSRQILALMHRNP